MTNKHIELPAEWLRATWHREERLDDSWAEYTYVRFARAVAKKYEELRAEEARVVGEPVAWANSATLQSAAVSRKRGGPCDTHTWSEGKTDYHDSPLFSSPPAPQEAQAEPAQWIDDPHDIEQGQMLNPEWLKLHGTPQQRAFHGLSTAKPAQPATEQAEIGHHEEQPDGTVTPVDPTDRGFKAEQAEAPSDKGTPGPWFVRKLMRDGEAVDAFVSAPDCNGFAFDAEILGDDEYHHKENGFERKLADCELIVSAVNAFRATQPTASNAGERENVADAHIKAKYVEWFGSDKGWLGEPGSWFIEGHRAALASKPPQGEQVDAETIADVNYQRGEEIGYRMGMAAARRAQPEQVAQDSQAARDVLSERRRQISVEGWTPEHDDEHATGAMAAAAGCYAFSAAAEYAENTHWSNKRFDVTEQLWPWDQEWWKPSGPRRDLVKAGALILAEIERLDRAVRARGEVKS